MPTYTMHVFRGEGRTGGFTEYKVEGDTGMVVLDVIHRIQATQAPDLAVRWNCKAGKCGSCSAEINGKPRLMCMTRMELFKDGETITVAPIRAFPWIRDLVTDVSYNYEKAKELPAVRLTPRDPDGKRRMMQVDVERGQEFRKCIECFLCQNTCHVVRDHEENKPAFAGPRFFLRYAELDMHPLDTQDRRVLAQQAAGIGLCNITKCCTDVCPEHIHITDNGIIPLKERVADRFYDPVMWVVRAVFGGLAAIPSVVLGPGGLPLTLVLAAIPVLVLDRARAAVVLEDARPYHPLTHLRALVHVLRRPLWLLTGALLESDNDEHSYREDEGEYFPAAATRTDANNHIAEDKTHVTHDYHFGQSFKPDASTKQFLAGSDIIDLSFIVRDQDVTHVTSSPYGDDDLAFIHPNGSGRVNLEVDLRHCAGTCAPELRFYHLGNFSWLPAVEGVDLPGALGHVDMPGVVETVSTDQILQNRSRGMLEVTVLDHQGVTIRRDVLPDSLPASLSTNLCDLTSGAGACDVAGVDATAAVRMAANAIRNSLVCTRTPGVADVNSRYRRNISISYIEHNYQNEVRPRARSDTARAGEARSSGPRGPGRRRRRCAPTA